MNDSHVHTIATELNVKPAQVAATIDLLSNDATVPFIARYRKEATGNLDEVAVRHIRDRIGQLQELDKRREAILKSLKERDLLTDELRTQIEAAQKMPVLEDIYLPFRPKRRTRATVARESGLEPLAELLLAQDDIDPTVESKKFVDPDQEVHSVEDALAGARDILAEWINEDIDARKRMRELFAAEAVLSTTVISGQEETGRKFKDYFDWSEAVTSIPSHRILAINRGERKKVLRVRVAPPSASALSILSRMFVMADNKVSEQVRLALEDGYRRLLAPAMESEIRAELKQRADADAIEVFAANVRELLMAPPLGQKRILAIDPGFRTGCKVVCLDPQGQLLDHTTIFPHSSEAERKDAAVEIKALVERFKTQVIAIGNGTAGRETEAFIREVELPRPVAVEMVNEAGASVYSASEVAREEFPEFDVTVRGAISIGRRLMDPLSELVKIDPKSIGVGQYQHDVDQTALKRRLDDIVSSCVNAVGVNVNTAGKQLLTFVSGLGPKLAESIVAYRNEYGPFRNRKLLTRVPRLGPKAFEQAAGFLRIPDSDNPLDRSAVHPESYPVVERIAADLNTTIDQLIARDELRTDLDIQRYQDGRVGLLTLQDIIDELAKPGHDPRAAFEFFQFNAAVNEIGDLKVDMRLPGIVTNVTNFGAFVDIGVHQDGLVHISELADKFVKDPNEIVRAGQKVDVRVVSVDIERGRIGLSMRGTRETKTW